jgi:5-methylcytosine-specific restriction endonuclease McrA
MIPMLSERVLVLNRLWQAVNMCTVKRAIVLLYCGHASVVYENNGDFRTFAFDDWVDYSMTNANGETCIHSTTFKCMLPEVVLLTSYEKVPVKEIKLTRHNIYQRDNNTCQYCGRTFDRRDLNLDHVIPRDLGGSTSWENLACSCKKCNARKGNRTPKQAQMHLIRKPKKPRWTPLSSYHLGTDTNHAWKKFIDPDHWDVDLGEEE